MADSKAAASEGAAPETPAQAWTQSIRVRSADVTGRRVMRISTLLKYIQEGTVRHTTALGMGRDKTLDRGLLWVITQQHLTIKRLPGYDEEITLTTWPGAQLHLFFPRYTVIADKDGAEIIRSKALWVLMDEKTRKIVFPQKYAVRIEGTSLPGDFPLNRIALPGEGDRLLMKRERIALFSECDINGHMNNSEYFDLLDDMMQEYRRDVSANIDAQSDVRSSFIDAGQSYEISAEYIDEIPYESSYQAELYRSEDGCLFQGGRDGHPLFRIRLNSR